MEADLEEDWHHLIWGICIIFKEGWWGFYPPNSGCLSSGPKGSGQSGDLICSHENTQMFPFQISGTENSACSETLPLLQVSLVPGFQICLPPATGDECLFKFFPKGPLGLTFCFKLPIECPEPVIFFHQRPCNSTVLLIASSPTPEISHEPVHPVQTTYHLNSLEGTVLATALLQHARAWGSTYHQG